VFSKPTIGLTFSLRGTETGGEAGCWSVPLEAFVERSRYAEEPRGAEPHDPFYILASFVLKEARMQYFMRISQHDERHDRAF
jgi:hypothetical protein